MYPALVAVRRLGLDQLWSQARPANSTSAGPPSASVVHGTSGGARNSVLAISCTRSGAVSATALTLAPRVCAGGIESAPSAGVEARSGALSAVSALDADLPRHQQGQQRGA